MTMQATGNAAARLCGLTWHPLTAGMRIVKVPDWSGLDEVEVCRPCHMKWFPMKYVKAPNEERLPKSSPKRKPLRLQTKGSDAAAKAPTLLARLS